MEKLTGSELIRELNKLIGKEIAMMANDVFIIGKLEHCFISSDDKFKIGGATIIIHKQCNYRFNIQKTPENEKYHCADFDVDIEKISAADEC